ncbi:MAG: patatin-like phospholipase family protein [Actinobacteria bacterium]|nr:patatin-like phospholipase family protein [Actinomycetota bacterium]
MTTAFVFSGGGSLGSVEAGMLLALVEADIRPDLVVGASVGSINAAWFAAHPNLEGARRLVEIWKGVQRNDVFPIQLVNGFLGFVGLHDSFITSDALRAMLARNLDVARLEDTEIPVRLIAADLATGQEVVLSHGDALDAIVASCAIPGIFPPVEIGGRYLVDGGVVNNAPVSVAVAEGADEIWVLPTGYACAPDAKPGGALGVVMQALTLMIHTRLDVDVERFRDECDLHVVPPLCPLAVLPVDFGHTEELIERAHETTSSWLGKRRSGRRRPGASVLGLHSHDPGGGVTRAGRVHVARHDDSAPATA